MSAIGEKTPVALGVVVAILGLAFWAGGLAQRVTVQETNSAEMRTVILEMNARSIEMQAVLEAVKELSADNKRRLDNREAQS